MRSFSDTVRHFLGRLFEAGVVSIVVVFDGCHETIKHTTHKERRSKRWDAMASLMREIRADTNVPAAGARDLTSICMYRMALIHLLQQLPRDRAQVVVGSGEADRLAAQICKSGKHFAVLAEDSDYLLMDARYMPLTSIHLGEDLDPAVLHGKVFTPERVNKGSKISYLC